MQSLVAPLALGRARELEACLASVQSLVAPLVLGQARVLVQEPEPVWGPDGAQETALGRDGELER